MFSRSLAVALLKLIDEKNISQEDLAEICHLSDRFIRNVISERQIPSLDSFEKICSGLEVDPNDLLIAENSRLPVKSKPVQVNQVLCRNQNHHNDYYALCPSCKKPLEREYQNYCDFCGQRLGWKQYHRAELIYEIPDK